MRKLLFLFLLPLQIFAQNFTYSGYIYNGNGSGAVNVPVKLYRRTNSTITGFTSQTNYNGHSYYRSTGTAYWTDAKAACANMGGHLVTMSNAAENAFVYNTWPSGWIGYYQDKTGAFYSEPNAGWRWTENYVTTNQQADYDVASYTSGTTLNDIKGSVNATLYNSPTYTSTGGKYLTFNGSNQYAITGNLGNKVGMNLSILVWIYPTGNGVIIDEIGTSALPPVWHDSQIEITGGNTLRMAVWGMSGNISTSITLNTWHLVGFTYDGTTLTGFKDGASFATATVSRQTPQQSGYGLYYGIGLADATSLGSGAYGAFRLGDFQVYSSALTSDEMNRNYMSTAWRFGVYPYSNWSGGEPNNSGGEDYIQFAGSGTWNDLPNAYALNYVLEFDYIVTTGTWSLYSTVYTNSSGYYSFNISSDPSKEYYIQIDAPNRIQTFAQIDGQSIGNLVLGTTTKNGLSFQMFDLNNDSKISVSDQYYLFARKSGRFTSWKSTVPDTRLYTPTEYNSIKSSVINVRSTYPGSASYTSSILTSGGALNYYIISPGYSGQVTY